MSYAVAQRRYLEKLKLLDLEEKDDLSYCSYTTKGVHVHIKLKICLDETRYA